MTAAAEILDLDARASFCLDLVRSAGKVALEGFVRRSEAQIIMKGPQDFLTETDAAVERHIKARLAEMFPDDGFIGEETGGATDVAQVWVVDPIDGTANFAREIPHFCIAVAFVAGGQTLIGAIYNPVLDELYFARRGQGATRNGVAIRVSGTTRADAACVELGWSTRIPTDQYVRSITAMLDHGANVRRGASGALGLAYVADGRSDGYAEMHMNAWDCLGGLLLVEEAGGVVAPFLSRNGLADGAPVLAATPAIAAALSAATGIGLT